MTFITNTLKQKYIKSAKLLYTDKDSLVYEIETSDGYEYFYKIMNLFDFSDYPEDSKFLILSIKKKLVKWRMRTKK